MNRGHRVEYIEADGLATSWRTRERFIAGSLVVFARPAGIQVFRGEPADLLEGEDRQSLSVDFPPPSGTWFAVNYEVDF